MARIHLTGSVGDDGDNEPQDVQRVRARLAELGFDWSAAEDTVDEQLIATIRLFQAIKNGAEAVRSPGNDGLIDVGGPTHRWLEARNAPRWERLPTGGADQGFVKVVDGDQHDFGTDWLAAVMVEAGALYLDEYRSAHPNAALMSFNDASLPRGGDTPDHAGHETGLSIDVKLPRTDGRAGGITHESALYDRAAMRAMLQAINAQPFTDRVYFNDDVVIGEGLCRAMDGHDNHAHVRLRAPERDDVP